MPQILFLSDGDTKHLHLKGAETTGEIEVYPVLYVKAIDFNRVVLTLKVTLPNGKQLEYEDVSIGIGSNLQLPDFKWNMPFTTKLE